MKEKVYQRYLETSVYTDVGFYKEFVRSLPDDIPTLGMLVCDQITHPSMFFTEPSPYLEDTYFGKFSSYPRHRFKNEDELYITAVSMIAGILRLDKAGFTQIPYAYNPSTSCPQPRKPTLYHPQKTVKFSTCDFCNSTTPPPPRAQGLQGEPFRRG